MLLLLYISFLLSTSYDILSLVLYLLIIFSKFDHLSLIVPMMIVIYVQCFCWIDVASVLISSEINAVPLLLCDNVSATLTMLLIRCFTIVPNILKTMAAPHLRKDSSKAACGSSCSFRRPICKVINDRGRLS